MPTPSQNHTAHHKTWVYGATHRLKAPLLSQLPVSQLRWAVLGNLGRGMRTAAGAMCDLVCAQHIPTQLIVSERRGTSQRLRISGETAHPSFSGSCTLARALDTVYGSSRGHNLTI